MKTKRPRRLRWRLAVPLTAAFFLLWLGTMVVLTNSACDRLEGTVSQEYEYAQKALEEQWEIYQNNRDNDLGAQADHILMYNLSAASGGLTDIGEGGMAFLVRNSLGQEVRSQLAYGYGHEAGVDQGQRWYLYFDDGLDDEGQLKLARWLTQHRSRSWDFALYPSDSWPGDGDLPNVDGTYARVTGVERSGYAIDVQKIELVHPDGTTEVMVETDTTGEDSITLELKFMRVASVLLPDYRGEGKAGPIDMELRLSNFREAQNRVHQGATEMHGSSFIVSGKLFGITEEDSHAIRVVGGQCDIRRAAVQGQWFLYISTFLLTAAAVLLLSAHLSKQVTRPVEQLSQGAQKGRCKTDGPVQELNALAEAFNAAQEQLEGQLERERAFTRGAAHELKTPLAVIHSYTQGLQEHIAEDKREKYLATICSEAERMNGMVLELLDLSRLEAGRVKLRRENFSLSQLTRSTLEKLAPSLEAKGLRLSTALEDPAPVLADRGRMAQVVENLLTNAVKYTPAGGNVQVEVAQTDRHTTLRVSNDCPPIPQEELDQLFEPFYRREDAAPGEGTGLGLAIVRHIVQLHGGSCQASATPGGVVFTVTL